MQKLPLWEIFKLKQWKHLPITELKKTWYSVFWANWKIGYYHEYMYENPMVLVSCRGAKCWAINLTDKNSWVTWNSIALVNLWKYEVETKYLYYVLRQTNFSTVISWSAQPQIIVWNLINLTIPFLPILNQKLIIQKLDKLTHLIELRKQSIQKTEQLTKSIFIEMFGDPMLNEKGWGLEKIINICERIVDCPHSTPVFQDDWYMCIDTTCIKPWYINLDKIRYVNKKTFDFRNKRMIPKEWDVLFSREWALLWIAVIVPKWITFCLWQRIMIFRLKPIISSQYFEFIFNSESFIKSYKWKIGW
jgi:type I restriction enzyme, S subunit